MTMRSPMASLKEPSCTAWRPAPACHAAGRPDAPAYPTRLAQRANLPYATQWFRHCRGARNLSPIGSISCAIHRPMAHYEPCLLYTSDAADEEDSVDLGGRRIIKKKKKNK